MKVLIRRQWNDYKIAEVDMKEITNLHWSSISGGVKAPSPRPFIHGYVWCDKIKGDISHSGTHGECPHKIKVCIVKKDNKKIWDKILEKLEDSD